jgi:hypothetical protein
MCSEAEKKEGAWHFLCHAPLFCYASMPLKCALTPDFSVAVAAVYRSPAPWLERHLGVFATGGADSGMHLPLLLIAVPIRAAK